MAKVLKNLKIYNLSLGVIFNPWFISIMFLKRGRSYRKCLWNVLFLPEINHLLSNRSVYTSIFVLLPYQWLMLGWQLCWQAGSRLRLEEELPAPTRAHREHPRPSQGQRSPQETLNSEETHKNIYLFVWIWKNQESETNKCRESWRQKWKCNILGFLALPKRKLLGANCTFYLFFIWKFNVYLFIDLCTWSPVVIIHG